MTKTNTFIALFFTLSLANSAQALTTTELPPNNSNLPWWGATITHWQSSPCKSMSAPSLSSVETYLANIADQTVSRSHKGGVEFRDESKNLLKAFDDLVANVDVQEQFQINPDCDKVGCAVEKIWGAELGKKILYMKIKHGFNGSEMAFDDVSRFNINEINQVLIGLEDLPQHLHLMGRKNNQRLLPTAPGSTFPGGKPAVADSTIKLYDSWRKGSNGYFKQYTLYHELGHVMGFRGGISSLHSSVNWTTLSMMPGCEVSQYGQSNYIEDFAESFAAYRYAGQTLKQACAAKYEFMKQQVFGQIEYTSEYTCNQSN